MVGRRHCRKDGRKEGRRMREKESVLHLSAQQFVGKWSLLVSNKAAKF